MTRPVGTGGGGTLEMDDDQTNRLRQVRLDALTAKNLHAARLGRLRVLTGSFLLTSILVPLFYVVPTYVAKGTPAEPTLSFVGFVLNVLLVAVAVVYLATRTDEARALHRQLLEENTYVANEAQEFLTGVADPAQLSWFFRYVVRVDSQDKALSTKWNEKERQKLYRAALSELLPGSTETVCPVCAASPFIFRPGLCQVCGNSPIKDKEIEITHR